MKKLLLIILTINIIGGIIGFFVLFFNNILLALLSIPFILLYLVPLFAIIQNMDDIEYLKEEIAILKHDIQSKADNPSKITENLQEPKIEYKEEARGNWECVKCKTVNKKGTYCCSNCKAPYSSWVNPTDEYSKKKKISKWVKF